MDSKEVLPSGFSSPQRPVKVAPDSEDSKFHPLGEATISLTGPDSEDFVGFVVFPTAADAQAQFKDQQGPDNFLLPGSSYPSTCYTGNNSSGNPAYGFTQCEVLIGNAYVFGNSRVHGSSQQQGNRNSTVLLTQFAVAHLQYIALLNSAVSSSELPRGFTSVQRLVAFVPSSEDTKFQAVVGVSSSPTGPDSEDNFGFVVLPTAVDAQAEFKDQQGSNNFTVPGSSYPSTCYSGSNSSANPAYGFTQCVMLVGNIYLYGNSRVYGSAQQGNRNSATALAQLAAAHLQKALPALPQ